MSFPRVCVIKKGNETLARAGDGMLAALRRNLVTTAGNLTISVEAIKGGLAQFSGAAGAVTYTTPTGTALADALPNMDIGDTFTFIISNTAAQVATIAGGTDVTASGTLTINAGFRIFVLEKTGATTFDLVGL